MEPPDDRDKTPSDHQVIALQIDANLLPEWFDAIKRLAVRHARRMAVLEKPEQWTVRLELPKASIAAFKEDLGTEWGAFVAERKAQGRWSEDD